MRKNATTRDSHQKAHASSVTFDVLRNVESCSSPAVAVERFHIDIERCFVDGNDGVSLHISNLVTVQCSLCSDVGRVSHFMNPFSNETSTSDACMNRSDGDTSSVFRKNRGFELCIRCEWVVFQPGSYGLTIAGMVLRATYLSFARLD